MTIKSFINGKMFKNQNLSEEMIEKNILKELSEIKPGLENKSVDKKTQKILHQLTHPKLSAPTRLKLFDEITLALNPSPYFASRLKSNILKMKFESTQAPQDALDYLNSFLNNPSAEIASPFDDKAVMKSIASSNEPETVFNAIRNYFQAIDHQLGANAVLFMDHLQLLAEAANETIRSYFTTAIEDAYLTGELPAEITCLLSKIPSNQDEQVVIEELASRRAKPNP